MSMIDDLRKKIEDKYKEAMDSLSILECYFNDTILDPRTCVPKQKRVPRLVNRYGRGRISNKVIAVIGNEWITAQDIAMKIGGSVTPHQVQGVVNSSNHRDKFEHNYEDINKEMDDGYGYVKYRLKQSNINDIVDPTISVKQ